MVNDQPDRDVAMHAMHTAIASRSLSPVDLTSPVLSPDATQPFSKTSTEERLGAMIPAEGASMQSSLNALNCESDRILAPTPGSGEQYGTCETCEIYTGCLLFSHALVIQMECH